MHRPHTLGFSSRILFGKSWKINKHAQVLVLNLFMSVYCYKVCNNHYTNHVILLWCSSSKRSNSNLGIVEPASATAFPRGLDGFLMIAYRKRGRMGQNNDLHRNGSAAHRSRVFWGYPTISHVKGCNPVTRVQLRWRNFISGIQSHDDFSNDFSERNRWTPWKCKLLEWTVLFLKLREINGLFVQSWWNFVQAKILMICPDTCKVDWSKWLKRLVKDKFWLGPAGIDCWH